MRMLYREKTYIAGDFIEVNIYPVFGTSKMRRKKYKPTSKTQERLNQIHAENQLARIINANFSKKDYKMELTYAREPESAEEAARLHKNFIRRVNYKRKKKGLPELKYVSVTQRGTQSGRYHHHIIMSGGLTPEEISEAWGLGFVRKIQPLEFNEEGLTALAKYMTRDRVGYKRWTGSRNLDRPEPIVTDGRLRQKDVRELARDTENKRLYEQYWPNYFVSSASVIENDINGGTYIYVRLYKKGAEFLRTSSYKNYLKGQQRERNRQHSSDGQNCTSINGPNLT